MHPSLYLPVIARALDEDLGLAGDLSAEGAVPAGAMARGEIVARAGGCLAGLDVAGAVFTTIDAAIRYEAVVGDGDEVAAGTTVAVAAGSARALLTAERTALNLLGLMSGVATATARLVALVEGTGVRIADTRKTIPGLRALQKYAVRMGGGINHRFGLFDAVMVKDNHIVAAGGIREAVESIRVRIGHAVTIEVEVTTLEELAELLEVGADIVLLDNIDLESLRKAVGMINGRMITEASGGITPETVRAIAETGVDVISSGWITHSAPTLDVALDFL